MAKQIIWSPLAEKDFDSILEYLEKNWGEKVIESFIDLTEKLIFQISLNPKLFPTIHKKEKIRKCVITKHNTMYYREQKDFIAILRIFDNRQDPEKLTF